MNSTVENLIFLDLETTGLSVVQDRIIEIGILPVDVNLRPLHEGWSAVITPTGYDLKRLNSVVLEMHTKNGLLAALEKEAIGILEATRQAIHYCEQFAVRGQLPLAGSTIHFDRGFLDRYMPGLDKWFHYRNADISSLKELWRRWFPDAGEPPKTGAHRALPDCYDSVAQALWYKQRLRVA